MPYKDVNKRRQYQRNWYAERKENFFKDKACKECGSKESLELHHRDPSQKEHHTIWGWSEERRLKEIEKCDVLCHDCHLEVSIKYISEINRGIKNPNAKLSKDDVIKIKKMILSETRHVDIAKKFCVTRTTIYDISVGKTWSWLGLEK